MRAMVESSGQRPIAWWEFALLAVAAVCALALGLTNLDGPSLWHDELVHVFVAKSVAAGQGFRLPSGTLYPSSMAYNAVLGGVVAVFGDGPAAVRAPSAVFSAVCVVLLYLLARRLLGRGCALVAAFALALSPWNVAWSREARLYTMLSAAYLAALYCAWRAFEAKDTRTMAGWSVGAFAGYLVGVFTSYHALLFLGPIGGYAVLRMLGERRLASRHMGAVVCCTVVGLVTIGVLFLNPNRADQSAVFQTGLGGSLVDPARLDRLLYFRWLANNLSIGVLVTVFIGSCLAFRRGWRGVFALLAFWVPVAVLTLLIGYRRPRFMFFAYPVYSALFALGASGLVQAVMLPWRTRSRGARFLLTGGLAALSLLFLLRLGFSCVLLTGDSLEAAGGADTTLARRHPRWEGPCVYVREHGGEGAILTTTCLPVMYYVGRVDDWFPNRYQAWEEQESGLVGIGSLDGLRAFLGENPKGFYIAEEYRFEKWRLRPELRDTLGAEVTWVQAHMRRVPEASSKDVTVYAWDFTETPVP